VLASLKRQQEYLTLNQDKDDNMLKSVLSVIVCLSLSLSLLLSPHRDL